jgi:hypothetical protein
MRNPLMNEGERASSSDRSFGLVFAILFAVLALTPMAEGSGNVDLRAAAGAGGFLLAGLLRPTLLRPLNRIWLGLGLVLHRILAPVMMTVLYLLAIVPLGLVLRAAGKDPLRLRRDPAASSYWISRDPRGPAADTMRNQF